MQILEAINKKAKIVQKVTSEEAVNYENLVSIIEDKIEIAKKEIEEIKEKLGEAKKLRRNRLEYDAVAVEVSKLPNKELTAAKLEGIRLDLVKLREIEETVEDVFQQRQKQFLVLVQSANRLQELLDQESDDDDEIYIEDDPTNEQQDEAITDSNNLVNVSNSTDEEMETGSPIDEQG
jgi:THO complex subunit 7